MDDPLVVALVNVVEAMLTRGVEVRPQGDGWLVRLADPKDSNAQDGQIGRSW